MSWHANHDPDLPGDRATGWHVVLHDSDGGDHELTPSAARQLAAELTAEADACDRLGLRYSPPAASPSSPPGPSAASRRSQCSNIAVNV
jgi:hypothetical protein